MTDQIDNLNDAGVPGTPSTERLVAALRAMPVPEPRPGFVDRALRVATRDEETNRWDWRRASRIVFRPETWLGAAVGAAATLVAVLVFLRPPQPEQNRAGITLTLNEMREIEVLIDSDRDLVGATIRVAVTGGVVLDGFDNEHIVDWQADLQRGSNLLSLPVVARSVGAGQLVAVVEHDGRTRTVTINLSVDDMGARS